MNGRLNIKSAHVPTLNSTHVKDCRPPEELDENLWLKNTYPKILWIKSMCVYNMQKKHFFFVLLMLLFGTFLLIHCKWTLNIPGYSWEYYKCALSLLHYGWPPAPLKTINIHIRMIQRHRWWCWWVHFITQKWSHGWLPWVSSCLTSVPLFFLFWLL